MTPTQTYEAKKTALLHQLSTLSNPSFTLKKKSASNLFRYMHRHKRNKKKFYVKNFDKIISIDLENKILDVEGLTSYAEIVQFTLSHGFLPTVTPELKHITIGGAIVGIGIESTCFQHGFVHDGLLLAEVLLPNGKIVTCTPDNEYADLFHALPNSYGTLGYILRAKIKLYPALPIIKMNIEHFTDPELFINAMQNGVLNKTAFFIEGLAFSKKEFYLMTGDFSTTSEPCDDIYQNIFYRLIQHKKNLTLKTEDYIFRYDPDWFWNIPETKVYALFRRFAPKSWRNSGIYKKYIDFKKKCLALFNLTSSINHYEETLIQDWEVPWDKGQELLLYALTHINIFGKPWAIIPIIPLTSPHLYPVKKNTLYFNLGCYSSSKRQSTDTHFYNTQLMDALCFKLEGIKMLYSSTLLSEEQFFKIYNGDYYQKLKHKYDPENKLGNLYHKVALSK